ncbi:MAG: EamA family transporter [Bacteroidota bacterium]
MYRLAPLFIIVAAALWGVDGIVLRPSLYGLPVPLVVSIESTIVTILLLPILIKNFDTIKKLSNKDWIAFFFVAFLGGAVGTMAITKALFYVNFVNLSVVILIQKLQPVFAIILAALFLREQLSKEFFLWAGLAILGAYLMTFGFDLPNFSTGDKTTIAALFSLVAAFSFGSSTVFSKRALRNVNFSVGTYLRFLLASIIMIIWVSFTNEISQIGEVSSTQWLVFFLIAFTTGGAAIFLYYYGLKNISASIATICELAFPLTAVILDYFLHGSVLNIVQWFGVVVLITSIIKVSYIKVTQ